MVSATQFTLCCAYAAFHKAMQARKVILAEYHDNITRLVKRCACQACDSSQVVLSIRVHSDVAWSLLTAALATAVHYVT